MNDWDAFVLAQRGHILQTQTWGQLKSYFGWIPATVRRGPHGALVLFRALPLGFTLAYVPRGPLGNWAESFGDLLTDLDALCRARRAICLKWEPPLDDSPAHRRSPEQRGGDAAWLTPLGFRPSPHTIQPRRTLVIDLASSEADILARMKQKTRYNIGLAAKKEIVARPSPDLAAFVELMRLTGSRDNFGVHSGDYYRRAYELFHPLGQCELFLADYRGEPLAGVMAFVFGQQAWYFYGASSDKERNRMAPYLAQWEAIRWAKARGALSYDLWGIPDEDEPALEAQFESRHDGLWGVYRFKRGWGGKPARTIGAWDKVYNPTLYQVYLLYLRLRRQTLG